MNAKLVLASSSPRRRELLRRMGIEFEVNVQPTDEHVCGKARDVVALFAERKAHAVADTLDEGIVLGADTLVALNDQVLGKPKDEREAEQMLRSLSGRAHSVFTGVCLIDAKQMEKRTHVEETRVFFRTLTEDEIDAYVLTGEPMDKAGAYAIQGKAGAFVEKIEGSFENVMGLPTQALEQMLRG